MSELITYLSYPFVRYCMICGVLVALCSSLLGTTLVLKRFSFMGDGLSHIAFGALAVATVLKITNSLVVVLPITVVAAILLLRTSSGRQKISGDAAIAMFSVTALAVGYLLLNIFPSSGNVAGDVCSTLFGSTNILTLNVTDVIITIVLTVATLAFFILFYNRIFAVTFDEAFSKATGTHTTLLKTLIAEIIAVVIVLAMNIVGSLLITALIIFPCISAMRILKSFKSVSICSAIIAVGTSLIGMLLSIILETPVGATIVAFQALVFLIFVIIGRIKR